MIRKTKLFLNLLSQETLLSTMPSGLFLVDTERHIVYWNPEAEKITGYSAAEAIGRHCSFLEGIECGNACSLFDSESPDKPVIGAECNIRTKSGEKVTISKNVDFLWQDGQIIGGIESFVDMTQQKNQEDLLRRNSEVLEKTVQRRTLAYQEERNRLREVLDSMPDLAYIVTADYRIDFLNIAMAQIVGESRGEVCHEVLHKLPSPCQDCPMSKIRRGQTVHEERSFDAKKGTYEIIHTPVYNHDGIIQKLAVCRDITQRKRAAEKLLEANRHLDAFAHTVSHDLRSPLTGVLGYTELLIEKIRANSMEDSLPLLHTVRDQSKRMVNLIDDLLRFSTAGYLDSDDLSVNTNTIIEDILKDNQFEILEKKIRITAEKLPSIRVPESLIYELFSNLILNAVRYGYAPGGEITVTGYSDDNSQVIIVRDNGPGIPKNERGRIFDAFYRGSTSNDTEGTGIGLATVSRIVDRFEGQVKLQETPGGGCTFIVQFPLYG
ncbi:MAG: hypothetical protein C0616_10430 [Desulfuromonas sp.]|nr:MAG: hypothetical protein C0616_10430 [Desulfuromonas sp.]